MQYKRNKKGKYKFFMYSKRNEEEIQKVFI